MAFVDSAEFGRPKRAHSVDELLSGGGRSWLREVRLGLRRKMVFLDDRAALRLLGFSTVMATGLLAVSLSIAWLIVRVALD
ncbi:MAG: hypothetical protein ACR2QH_10760 [Geminicoccaceae bacterium]